MFSLISISKLVVTFCLLVLFIAHVTAQNDGDNSTGCGNGGNQNNNGNNSTSEIICGSSSAKSGGSLSHGDIGGIVVGVVVPVALFVLGCFKWKKIKKWYHRHRENSSSRTALLPTTQLNTSANTPVSQTP